MEMCTSGSHVLNVNITATTDFFIFFFFLRTFWATRGGICVRQAEGLSQMVMRCIVNCSLSETTILRANDTMGSLKK